MRKDKLRHRLIDKRHLNVLGGRKKAMSAEPYVDKNIELSFTERGCPLGFKCRATGVGNFEVEVFEDAKTKNHEIARLVGGDERTPMPQVQLNAQRLPNDLLADLYHMARCRREMKRVGTDGPNYEGYANGYTYHKDRFLKRWKDYAKAQERRLVAH
jgi:hypothetical protein